ncbi:E3 ubiquitin-protein ligase TRIM33-like [Anneissia japonica]|uniref:E3 ubiquitin-protein ligase TRIM33-like n=1 Tax=Anneissia japonica TaxID=1529436 RepID=UPI00142552E1|nr:E3 ubiquitin-protein ligase TRIM33-like [Anneissia japonica]
MDNLNNPSCPVCMKDLATRQPKLMPCLHTVCKACILVNPETATSRCPVCSQECRLASDVIDDYFIISAAAKSDAPKETLCTSCEDRADASSYCQDCQEWLCDACVQAHYRVRVTKDHIISRKTDAERALARVGDRPLFCPNHKQEQLQLYCETCDRLTCRDCQLLHHKEHRYQFVSEASARHKSSLKVLLNKLAGKQVSITQTKDLINQKINDVSKKQDHMIRNIQNLTSKVILEINETSRRNIAELTSHCDKKRSFLSTQMHEAVKLEKILRHCHQFTSLAVQSSSNIALLQTKKQIIKQLILVLRTGCTRHPVTGLDINYVVNVNNQSLAQLKNLGTLVVKEQQENQSAATAPNPHLKPQPHFSLQQPPGHSHNNRGSYPMQAVAPNIHMHRPVVTTLPQTSSNMLASQKHQPNLRYAGNNLVLGTQNSNLYRERVENCLKTKERLKILSSMAPAQGTITNSSSPGPSSSSASGSPNAPLIEPKKEPVSPGESRPPSKEHHTNDNSVAFVPIRIENVVSLHKEESVKLKDEVIKDEVLPSCAVAGKHGGQMAESSSSTAVTSNSSVEQPSFSFNSTIDSILATKPAYVSSASPDDESLPPSSSKDHNDPNEDWCAVCKNGGDLLCCDSCPRVFHLNCHIPILPNTPSDAFICTLCKDVGEEVLEGGRKRKISADFSERDQKVCERILLELFCHPSSFPFHEPVDRSVPNYYKVISKPMELVTIKEKLKPSSTQQYESLDEFISDVKLMFSNCLLFNGETSDIGRVARNIERFFLKQLKKFFPDYTEDLSSNYQEDRFNKRKRRPQDILHIK